jgi:hypothetical protein
MSKVIASVPESISREDYISWFTKCGFIPSNVVSLKFTGKGVYAKVFERDGNGNKMVVGLPGEEHTDVARSVVNEVFIPVLPYFTKDDSLHKLSATL